MKTLAATVLAAALLLALPACHTTEGLARNQAATAAWLAEAAEPPAMNVTGSWHAEDWGHGYLRQNGARVTGHIAQYPVYGTVSGTTLYLAVTEDGVTEDTIVARLAAPGILEGHYSGSVPFTLDEEDTIRLVRAAR